MKFALVLSGDDPSGGQKIPSTVISVFHAAVAHVPISSDVYC